MRIEHRPDYFGEPTHVIIDEENGYSVTIRRIGGKAPMEPGILVKYIVSACKAAVNWVESQPDWIANPKDLWS